jgi:hypothetical protein
MSAVLVIVLSQKITMRLGYLTPIFVVVMSFFLAGLPACLGLGPTLKVWSTRGPTSLPSCE